MLTDLKPVPFKPSKPLIITWNTWRKGLNTLLRETEIDGAEMVSSTNLQLTGSGIPTRRWGSQLYFQSGATGVARYVGSIKDNNDNIQVLGLSDWGYLTQQSGASYSMITGASWASGYNIEMAQLGGKAYFVSPQREMTRYDFTTLQSFATLTPPTGITVSALSSVSGLTTWSWKVTATSPVGESLWSQAVSLASLPQILGTTIRVKWSPVSAASGQLTGYNIYRGIPGSEVWVGGTDLNTTTFDDTGTYISGGTLLAPRVDTTAGPKAKFIIRFQDRLILAGIPGDPTKVLVSGRYPYHERFDIYGGGTYLRVEPDSGEDITGVGIYYRTQTSTQTIVVFKEHSVWEIALDQQSQGYNEITTASYRLLTGSQGCSSHRSVIAVENDVMFCNRRGIFILRYEPNLINVINANEISAKIRTFFQSLSYNDIANASAVYADKKYVLSFPFSKQHICFDRERLSFTGPWQTPWNINKWTTYTDATGGEHWLAATDNGNNIMEFSNSFRDDGGAAIQTVFKTRKEDFGDWTLFKTINEMYMNLRNVQGSIQVNVYVENRLGQVLAVKSFTVIGSSTTGTSGMGINQLGLNELGLSTDTGTVVAGELQRKALMYKVGRTIQIEVITSNPADSYELLGIKTVAIPQARGNNPTSWNV